MNTPPTNSRAGAFSHLTSLLGVSTQYLSARIRLAGLEAKEAGAHYGLAAGMIAGALFVAVLGYVFLVMTIVFGIAAAFDSKHAWIVVMGGVALLHVGGAVALTLLAWRRMKAGAFSHTLEEFKKDTAWLATLNDKR